MIAPMYRPLHLRAFMRWLPLLIFGPLFGGALGFVDDTDPARAANFANAVANVFVKQNTDLQASRYASSRDNLAQLVSQLQSDINGRQAVVNGLQAQPASPERDAQLAQAQNGLDQLRTTYGNTL